MRRDSGFDAPAQAPRYARPSPSTAPEAALFAPDSPVGLVADIGGTNTRLALAGLDGGGAPAVAFRRDMRNADHAGVEACVRAYLDGLELSPTLEPTLAAFGVASPAGGDVVRLTNRDWSFSVSDMKARFGWTRFEVMNDFVAIGHALGALKREHWRPLPGPSWPDSLPERISLVGPGTGLGVGQVLRGPAGEIVVPTEGGHGGFAPGDAEEIGILRVLLARFRRVSNERLLSGPGLENLYGAMAEIRDRPAKPPPAPAIVEAAMSGGDPFAREVLRRFCLILAGAMGDVALVQGAQAVAIAGGVAPRILAFLDAAEVRSRFEAKGRVRKVMAGVPCAVIVHPEPGLLGAARRLLG